jgi:hypothetical protein
MAAVDRAIDYGDATRDARYRHPLKRARYLL